MDAQLKGMNRMISKEKLIETLEKATTFTYKHPNYANPIIMCFLSTKELKENVANEILSAGYIHKEDVEVDEEKMLEQLVYISWCLQRDGKNNLLGKEQLKTAIHHLAQDKSWIKVKKEKFG